MITPVAFQLHQEGEHAAVQSCFFPHLPSVGGRAARELTLTFLASMFTLRLHVPQGLNQGPWGSLHFVFNSLSIGAFIIHTFFLVDLHV